jgi:hypothetical protein
MLYSEVNFIHQSTPSHEFVVKLLEDLNLGFVADILKILKTFLC